METRHLIGPAVLAGLAKREGAYLVGGTVRDLLLDRPPGDYDIAVDGDPEAFARELLASRPGSLVVLGRPGQAVVRAATQGSIFDICRINGRDIEADLLQRDFSINAMALRLSSGELVDPAGGKRDLAAAAVRAVSPGIFRKDPVRLLRAYRLAAELAFRIAPDTAAAIAECAPLIQHPAGERLREELFKLLAVDGAARYISEMAHSGLLTCLLPEMLPLKGCPQPPPHRHDVFDHSLAAVFQLETLLTQGLPGLDRRRGTIGPMTDPASAARLKCAALLHDTGKPACRTVDGAGRIHFYGHAARSAEMIARVGRRLRFSRAESAYIDTIVRHHTRPLSLFEDWRRERLSPRAVVRLFDACRDRSPDLVLHAVADMNAKTADTDPERPFERFGLELIERFFASFAPIGSRPPLVNGHDLMRRFGLRPSPLIGRLLDEIRTARLAGTLTTRQEAEALVAEILENPPPEAGGHPAG